MAEKALMICLMSLVALSVVYETQATFSLPHYIKNFPKLGKDFEPFAFKAMLEFMGDLEGKCPRSTKFNDFFVKLKDYMSCFDSTSPDSKDIQVQLTIKSESLFRVMSAFNGTKGGTSEDSWRLVDGLLSLGKVLVEMKKSRSKEINFEQRREMIQSMVKWTRGIGVFVKMASENEGHSIDLSSFGIDYDTNKPSNSKRSLYETRGSFSLPHYLKDLPKISKDFEPFAYNGMLDFMASLEVKCPDTAEFKNFFEKVEDYMTCFKSGLIDIMKVDISNKSEELFRAMSLLDGGKTGTSVESWRMMDGMLSIGKLLGEMKKNGSKEITFEQRKEIVGTMVKWARAIGLFVKTASEKKGKSIDLSSLGIDYAASPFQGANGEL